MVFTARLGNSILEELLNDYKTVAVILHLYEDFFSDGAEGAAI